MKDKVHHLTLQERKDIEDAITQGLTKAEIAHRLGKDPAGISREIKRHRELKPRNTFGRPTLCENRRRCKKRCTKPCDQYREPVCYRRDNSSGACNGCEKRSKCQMDKYFYHAARADASYRTSLVASREGINMTPEERDKIGGIIAPLLKQGQSVYQIKSSSIDGPNGFRGAAHRHLPDQVLFITEDSASPGLLAGKLDKGKWKITISTHAVVTDVCNYRLFITEEEELK